jgi:hypothetical protein
MSNQSDLLEHLISKFILDDDNDRRPALPPAGGAGLTRQPANRNRLQKQFALPSKPQN